MLQYGFFLFSAVNYNAYCTVSCFIEHCELYFQNPSSIRVVLIVGAHFLRSGRTNPMVGVEEYGERLRKVVHDLESFNISVR